MQPKSPTSSITDPKFVQLNNFISILFNDHRWDRVRSRKSSGTALVRGPDPTKSTDSLSLKAQRSQRHTSTRPRKLFQHSTTAFQMQCVIYRDGYHHGDTLTNAPRRSATKWTSASGCWSDQANLKFQNIRVNTQIKSNRQHLSR